LATQSTTLKAYSDARVVTFAQASAPTAKAVGDLWMDTANGNLLKRWSGSAWVAADDTRIGSTASTVTTIQSTVTNNNNTLTAAIQTEANTRVTQTGELYAQYTVKVDLAGSVSGYGLASTLIGATPKSAFGVRADKFWIAAPVSYTQATTPTAASWGTTAIYALAKGVSVLAVGGSAGAMVGSSTETWVRATGLATVWGSTQANAACYGGGVYLVVGASGKAATSVDGKTWVNQAGLASTTWGTTAANAVCYGNGMFVVIGDSGKCAKGVYNPETQAVTWTYTDNISTLWSASSGMCLIYAYGEFIAFGAGGKTASSVDGITWSTVVTGTSLPTAMGSNTVRASIAAAGIIVAVGDSGKVATTINRTDWTARSSLAGTTWGTSACLALVYTDSVFVVVGDSGKVATSIDGITWTYRSGLSSTAWGTTVARAALYHDGKVMVAGDSGKIASSADGVTWVYSNSLSTASDIYNGCVWVDTSVTQNVTKYYVDGAWTTTSPNLQFVVTASPDIINGIPIPAGVYMDAAYIKNGTITNAKIGFAAIDDAKITSLSATKIKAGSVSIGEYIQSSGYVSGASGWRINGNGNAEFSGAVIAATGTFSGSLTAEAVNAVNTINLAGNSVTVSVGQTIVNTTSTLLEVPLVVAGLTGSATATTFITIGVVAFTTEWTPGVPSIHTMMAVDNIYISSDNVLAGTPASICGTAHLGNGTHYIRTEIEPIAGYTLNGDRRITILAQVIKR